MPWRSLAQERWGHSQAARDKGFTPDKVAEFDAATKGAALPDRVQAQARAKPAAKPKPRSRSLKAAKVPKAAKVKRA